MKNEIIEAIVEVLASLSDLDLERVLIYARALQWPLITLILKIGVIFYFIDNVLQN